MNTIALLKVAENILNYLDKYSSFTYHVFDELDSVYMQDFDIDDERDRHTLTAILQHAHYQIQFIEDVDPTDGTSIQGFTVKPAFDHS